MLTADNRTHEPRTLRYLTSEEFLALMHERLTDIVDRLGGKLRVWRVKCPPDFLENGPKDDVATIDTLVVGLPEGDSSKPGRVNFLTLTTDGEAYKILFRGKSHGGPDAELTGVTIVSTIVHVRTRDLLSQLQLP